MEAAVSVQQMQDERAYSAVHRVPTAPVIRLLDSKRMVEHCVAEAAHELFSIATVDPDGLIITVNKECMPDGSCTYVVSASLPQYESVAAE